jgi:hypothetical protein
MSSGAQRSRDIWPGIGISIIRSQVSPLRPAPRASGRNDNGQRTYQSEFIQQPAGEWDGVRRVFRGKPKHLWGWSGDGGEGGDAGGQGGGSVGFGEVQLDEAAVVVVAGEDDEDRYGLSL